YHGQIYASQPAGSGHQPFVALPGVLPAGGLQGSQAIGAGSGDEGCSGGYPLHPVRKGRSAGAADGHPPGQGGGYPGAPGQGGAQGSARPPSAGVDYSGHGADYARWPFPGQAG
ncbi:hypothetical protein LPJ70_007168, partial [Coemansia sp. RSA 2708]